MGGRDGPSHSVCHLDDALDTDTGTDLRSLVQCLMSNSHRRMPVCLLEVIHAGTQAGSILSTNLQKTKHLTVFESLPKLHSREIEGVLEI